MASASGGTPKTLDGARTGAGGREPEWLRGQRERAWEIYLRTPLPDPRDEAWRRTSLADLDLGAHIPADGPPPADAGRVGLSAAEDLAARGVVFTDLAAAAHSHPELVARHLGSLIPAEESKFAALNAALWRHGCFVHVPAGLEVALPLQSVLDCGGAAAVVHRTLVIAEAGSRVTLVESLPGPGAEETEGGRDLLHCAVVEVFAGPDAHVRYGALQRLGPAVWSFSFRRARLAAGSRVEWFAGEFGGRLVRSETHALLEEEGATARAVVAYFATGRQHVDVTAGADHRAARTESEVVARGAVAGDGRAVYRGLGRIARGAKGADMSQKQRALVLSRTARADAIPALFIDENDVRAGHAAAAGPLDREPLFYLMSRGIPAERARHMLVRGFFDPLLEQVPLPALREGIETLIDRKLGDA